MVHLSASCLPQLPTSSHLVQHPRLPDMQRKSNRWICATLERGSLEHLVILGTVSLISYQLRSCFSETALSLAKYGKYHGVEERDGRFV